MIKHRLATHDHCRLEGSMFMLCFHAHQDMSWLHIGLTFGVHSRQKSDSQFTHLTAPINRGGSLAEHCMPVTWVIRLLLLIIWMHPGMTLKAVKHDHIIAVGTPGRLGKPTSYGQPWLLTAQNAQPWIRTTWTRAARQVNSSYPLHQQTATWPL